MSRVQRFIGIGSIERAGGILSDLGAARVFLVTGQQSFSVSGAAAALQPAFAGRSITRFSGFSENPKLEDALRGLELLRRAPVDAVLAVGGGSAIDMAKLVNVLAAQDASPERVVRGEVAIQVDGLPLVAVPTTSGSGSEATPFAVVYLGHTKYSVASQAMLPVAAIVDPALTFSLSPRMTAVTGLDALAQAIESYWSIHSTEVSKGFSREAVMLALQHLPAAVHAPTAAAREGMSRAAHLAGQAIAITRTTGPHALSYPLTSYYGVPHGQAVSLTLGQFLVYNQQVTDADVTDARGAGYVREAVRDIVSMLGARTAADAAARIRSFIGQLGLADRLGALGVAEADLTECILANVNAERMANNPRALDSIELRRLVQEAF